MPATRRYINPELGRVAAIALIVVAIAIVYARALHAPLIFDDHANIEANPSIRQVATSLNPPKDFGTAGRPLVNATFAVNYWLGGMNPTGYHVFNFIVHTICAMLLFSIVRRTLKTERLASDFGNAATPLAFAIALIWAVHPLQTEAVVYISQRTELLMAMCYLATVYFSLRYWTSDAKDGWLALATLSCFAGMASKEVMVSAPIIVLMLERTFIARSFRDALRRSWPLYVGLASAWLLLLALNIHGPRADSAGFRVGIAAHAWWLTQARVLFMYLRLAFWPSPLVIHYDLPMIDSLATGYQFVLPAALLLVTSIVAIARRARVGFLIAWFFAILAPTLIVPIVTEIAAERRMYLSLAAIVALLVLGFYRVMRNRIAIVLGSIACAIVLSAVTMHRLAAYANEVTLWQDAVAHQPPGFGYLAYGNLGRSLLSAGRAREAIDALRRARELKPDIAETSFSLAQALERDRQIDDAIRAYDEALRLRPNYPDAHYNLGLLLRGRGRADEALDHFAQAVEQNPNFAEAHNNLAVTLIDAGRLDEATKHCRQALAIDPNLAEAHNTMGMLNGLRSLHREAIDEFARATQLKPDFLEGYANLAQEYATIGQLDQAIANANKALELARARGEGELVKRIESMIDAYRAKQRR